MKTQLQSFLEGVGAKDLVGWVLQEQRNGNRTAFGTATGGRMQTASQDNKSIALLFEGGETHILYGLGDRNFSPVKITFDQKGAAQTASVPLSGVGRSGVATFRAEPQILSAISSAANALKSGASGTGHYMGWLAKSAGAVTPRGNTDWGTNKISEARNTDTGTPEGSMNAASALLAKWDQHRISFPAVIPPPVGRKLTAAAPPSA